MDRMRVYGSWGVWVALIGSMSIAACDSTTAMSLAQDVATSLSISANGSSGTGDPLVLEVGDTVTVTAMATNPLGLAVSAGTVTWSSADSTVVRVDASGLVTGVGTGTSEVRAVSGEAVGSLTTVVNDSASF